MKENTLSRRQFAQGAVGAVTAGMLVSMESRGKATVSSEGSGLQDRIFGCIAGSRMGSAFGAPVEGWSVEKIKAKYGVLDEFKSYGHYKKQWQRPPGDHGGWDRTSKAHVCGDHRETGQYYRRGPGQEVD